MQQGPCLAHCYTCSGPAAALAYLALGYLIASLVYLLVTKLTMGTPFKDSLTPEQRALLAASSAQRRTVFWAGALVATVALCAVRPFSAA